MAKKKKNPFGKSKVKKPASAKKIAKGIKSSGGYGGNRGMSK